MRSRIPRYDAASYSTSEVVTQVTAFTPGRAAKYCNERSVCLPI